VCPQQKARVSCNSCNILFNKNTQVNTTSLTNKNETKYYTLQHVCLQQKARVSCNSCNILFNKNTTLKLREYAPRPCSGSLHKLHTVVHCNTLQRSSTHCNTLQHTVAKILQHPLQQEHHSQTLRVCSETLSWFSAQPAHCGALQHTATLCDTLRHTTSHCSTLQHAL